MTTGRSTAKTHQIGSTAEDEVKHYIEQHGLMVILQNYHCIYGEIDLIALDGDTLVFIEVRYRRQSQFATAVDTVTYKKQQKLTKTAQNFLLQFTQYERYPCRFDVIGIDQSNQKLLLTWIKAAFVAEG